MSDKYYDLQEQRRYAEHFISAAAAYTSLDPVVERLIGRQAELLRELEAQRTTLDDRRSDARMSQGDLRILREESRTQLDRLFTYLQGQQAMATFDFLRFFPTGRRKDIGSSIADVRESLERALDGLNHYPDIPGAKEWKEQIEALMGRYVPASDRTSREVSGARSLTDSTRTSRATWRRHYRACRLVMEGLLTEVGRETELSTLFLHLQVGQPRSSGAAPTADA